MEEKKSKRYDHYISDIHSGEIDYSVEFMEEPTTQASEKKEEVPFDVLLKQAVEDQREPIPEKKKIVEEPMFDINMDMDFSWLDDLDPEKINFVPIVFNGKEIHDLSELTEKK